MADTATRGRTAAVLWRGAVLAATIAALASCGGQSDHDRVSAVARAYDRAFMARDGRTLCALMTTSLRRELTSLPGSQQPGQCADLLASAAGTVRDAAEVHPVVSGVRITGARATATIQTTAGVAMLPLAREASRRVRSAGPSRFPEDGRSLPPQPRLGQFLTPRRAIS